MKLRQHSSAEADPATVDCRLLDSIMITWIDLQAMMYSLLSFNTVMIV